MLRKLVLAAIALALPLATAGVAPPPGVNLQNGYVVIHNRQTDSGINTTLVFLEQTSGNHYWHANFAPGQTHIVNVCCVHAGPYWLHCTTGGIPGNCHGEYIRPRVCTHDRVTFRYAEVEIRGVIAYHNGNRQYYYEALPSWHQIDTACPS